jgi:hypothetical protein
MTAPFGWSQSEYWSSYRRLNELGRGGLPALQIKVLEQRA